jgi:hypothetical protein
VARDGDERMCAHGLLPQGRARCRCTSQPPFRNPLHTHLEFALAQVHLSHPGLPPSRRSTAARINTRQRGTGGYAGGWGGFVGGN